MTKRIQHLARHDEVAHDDTLLRRHAKGRAHDSQTDANISGASVRQGGDLGCKDIGNKDWFDQLRLHLVSSVFLTPTGKENGTAHCVRHFNSSASKAKSPRALTGRRRVRVADAKTLLFLVPWLMVIAVAALGDALLDRRAKARRCRAAPVSPILPRHRRRRHVERFDWNAGVWP